MKKVLFSIFAMAIMAFSAQATVPGGQHNSTTFNLKMNVDKYIEAMCGPVDFNFGTTQHVGITKAEELCGKTGSWDLAYANCPFSVTISGNNGANQGVPRFARQETGAHGGAWDILNTVYDINIATNGAETSFNSFDIFGIAVPKPIGAKDFPKTKNFSEAPHNGQVHMSMKAFVNTYANMIFDNGTPLRQTIINPSWTNDKSADAGEYSCTMIVTLAAL